MSDRDVLSLSWAGIAAMVSIVSAIAGGVVWFSTKSFEEGKRASDYQHLTNKLAKLESVDEQRASMKERAEHAESELKAIQEKSAILQSDFRTTQEQLAAAKVRLSSAEKCGYLEDTARLSAAELNRAINWANQSQGQGYEHSYYKESSARNARDLEHLTACLTSSGK